MDIVEACRAFVSVSEHGSFTLGAASVRAPQSVVSRRIAALEKHLGDTLFDRTSRRVALTPFGGDLLPSAKRLIELADALHHDAERARRRPFRLAVPDICSPVDLARLDVEARQLGIYLDFLPAGPAARAELTRSLGVRAALIAVPANEGTWSVPLGLAGATGASAVADLPAGPVYLESLRPSRARPAARTIGIWIQPEDDVPHVRDRLTRLRDSVALSPSQVTVPAASPQRRRGTRLGGPAVVLARAGGTAGLALAPDRRAASGPRFQRICTLGYGRLPDSRSPVAGHRPLPRLRPC